MGILLLEVALLSCVVDHFLGVYKVVRGAIPDIHVKGLMCQWMEQAVEKYILRWSETTSPPGKARSTDRETCFLTAPDRMAQPSMLYFRDTSQGPGGSQASEGLPHGTSSPSWSWHPRPQHVLSDTAAGAPRAAGVSAGGSAGVGCRSAGAGCLGEKAGVDGGVLPRLCSTLNLRASSRTSTAPPTSQGASCTSQTSTWLLSQETSALISQRTTNHNTPDPLFSLQLPVHLHMNLSLHLQRLC